MATRTNRQQAQPPYNRGPHRDVHTLGPFPQAGLWEIFKEVRILGSNISLTSRATPVNPTALAAVFATDLPPSTLPVKDTKSTDFLLIT